jgi:amino acid transporter
MSGDFGHWRTPRGLFWVLAIAACFLLGVIGANFSERIFGVLGGLALLGLAAIFFALWLWAVQRGRRQLSDQEYRLLRLGFTTGVTLVAVSWILEHTFRVGFWTGECIYSVGMATILLVIVMANVASRRNKRLYQS